MNFSASVKRLQAFCAKTFSDVRYMAAAVATTPATTGNPALVSTQAPAAAATAATAATPAVTPLAAPTVAPAVKAVKGSGIIDGAQQTFSAWSGYLEVIAIIVAVLAAIWLIVWLLRRRNDIQATQVLGLRVESRLALGPKKWLVVARFLDKRIMLGVTDNQITLLSEQPYEELPAGKKDTLSLTPNKL